MEFANPAGTDGFDFLEFCTSDLATITNQFTAMGFRPVARHKKFDITLFQQGNIKFFVNTAKGSHAEQFADLHGPSTSAMGFRVLDAKAAYKHALEQGAIPYQSTQYVTSPYSLPAIYGVGNSLIYFVDYHQHQPAYHNDFQPITHTSQSASSGLTYIDHVTHNLKRGNMSEWADFYSRIFNFREIRHFDIEGKVTGLKSKAMTSPCGKIRIPLNESSDDKSQIEEFLHDFRGEGIQHIALGTSDIYSAIDILQTQAIQFLDTPDTYYQLINKRLPNHGESIEKLKQLRILIDGSTQHEKRLLLQIFTKNMLGPVFFEIIQRKGDEGFGEGNFKALFESIELDQINRGTLQMEIENS